MNYTNKGCIFINNIIKINSNIIINKINYNLLGVILKSGLANRGHYIYATFNQNIINIYDDDYTKELNYNNSDFIDFNYSGFELSKNAYLLLYYRNDNSICNILKITKNINKSKKDYNIGNIINKSINFKVIYNKKNSICNILKGLN